jgi:hypothetical protein
MTSVPMIPAKTAFPKLIRICASRGFRALSRLPTLRVFARTVLTV